ncbi:PTS transporter subunit EIIB [Demequina pelophila]|uniref:PTS transporter subunit EIIB n=1 Tax=Demequina pelophila TaxID=1638984 RepID=UPI00078588E5|nr:PTS transporter subunit EIIB [Demequina pelophila]
MQADTILLASAVITLAGGVDNVEHVGRCLVRLRLRLLRPEDADVDAIGALPGVSIAIRQGREVHVAPAAGLDALHATVCAGVGARR